MTAILSEVNCLVIMTLFHGHVHMDITIEHAKHIHPDPVLLSYFH